MAMGDLLEGRELGQGLLAWSLEGNDRCRNS